MKGQYIIDGKSRVIRVGRVNIGLIYTAGRGGGGVGGGGHLRFLRVRSFVMGPR